MSFSAASLRAVLDAHAPAGATGLAVALSGGYSGSMSLTQALTHSINTIAVKISIAIGDFNNDGKIDLFFAASQLRPGDSLFGSLN